MDDDDVKTCYWSLQVSHLQELVREGEQNLGSAQTQITCLRETQEKLKIELDATRSRVRETSNLLTDLQVSIRPRLYSFILQPHSFLTCYLEIICNLLDIYAETINSIHAYLSQYLQVQLSDDHSVPINTDYKTTVLGKVREHVGSYWEFFGGNNVPKIIPAK